MGIVDDAGSVVTAVILSEEVPTVGFSSHGPSDSAHDELISGPEYGEIVDHDGEIEEFKEEVDSGTVDASSSRGTVCKGKDPGDHVRRAELLRRFAPLIAKSTAQLCTLHQCTADGVGTLHQCADGGPPCKKARVAPHDVPHAQMEVHVEVIAERSARSWQQERDAFRSAIAAMEKTVDISNGSTDLFPVDGSGDLSAPWAQSYAFSRSIFEAATGLTLIPDGDDEDALSP